MSSKDHPHPLLADCESKVIAIMRRGEAHCARVHGDADNIPCPVEGCVVWGPYSLTLSGNCAHLNDIHRWTREQIADWVEEIELDQEVKEACDAYNEQIKAEGLEVQASTEGDKA